MLRNLFRIFSTWTQFGKVLVVSSSQLVIQGSNPACANWGFYPSRASVGREKWHPTCLRRTTRQMLTKVTTGPLLTLIDLKMSPSKTIKYREGITKGALTPPLSCEKTYNFLPRRLSDESKHYSCGICKLLSARFRAQTSISIAWFWCAARSKQCRKEKFLIRITRCSSFICEHYKYPPFCDCDTM